MRVITYRYCYVSDEVDLCRSCADRPDISRTLGPVQVGEHEGFCEECYGEQCHGGEKHEA